MQHYLDNDLKLRKFVPLIQQSVVYPAILDANRTVLSLPPIINGAHSAVRVLTRPICLQAQSLQGAQLPYAARMYKSTCRIKGGCLLVLLLSCVECCSPSCS